MNDFERQHDIEEFVDKLYLRSDLAYCAFMNMIIEQDSPPSIEIV